MGEERGRSSQKGRSGRMRRSLSRSKSAASVKKMMKGLTRKKKRKDGTSVDHSKSTGVSVQADEFSAAASANAKVEKPRTALTLQLVLLLMDPSTRRFELLQLEFDSDKARVSDVLAQIPISVTEAAIRSQIYQGVIDSNFESKDEFSKLVDFCGSKTVLVAVPKGLEVKECVRLARPILCDKQVERMLTAGGFDISGWKNSKKDKKSLASVQPVEEPASGSSGTGKDSDQKSLFPTIVMLAVFAIIIQSAHSFLSLPIQVGVPLKPGTWKSRCGLVGLLPPPVQEFVSAQDFYKCTNSFLEVHNDGTVTIQDSSKEVDVLLKGKKKECADGLVLEENGKLYMCGSQIKTAYLYGETKSLSPWPFAEKPKLKLKNSSRR